MRVSTQELSVQDAVLLPVREALQAMPGAVVNATNLAVAVPGSSGDALADGGQTAVLFQGGPKPMPVVPFSWPAA